jgi:quercetin dioxygenase-like cupin family protein
MRQIGMMLLLTATLALSLGAQKSVEHAKTYTPDAIRWGAAPDALPSGAQLAVLEGDPTKPGPYTMRLKMPDGYKIPPHHHARREHVTVISGAFKVGMGDSFDAEKMNEFAPGSFAYLEPTMHHYAMAKGETVIQLHGAGPWEIIYVNPVDDPRGSAGSGKTKKQ